MFRWQRWAKVLAAHRIFRCNALSLNPPRRFALARSRRLRIVLPEFETCSLALFAALAMSAPSMSRAQATFGPARAVTSTPAATATASTQQRATRTLILTPSSKAAVPAAPADKTKR
jgi:hypothetical protein